MGRMRAQSSCCRALQILQNAPFAGREVRDCGRTGDFECMPSRRRTPSGLPRTVGVVGSNDQRLNSVLGRNERTSACYHCVFHSWPSGSGPCRRPLLKERASSSARSSERTAARPPADRFWPAALVKPALSTRAEPCRPARSNASRRTPSHLPARKWPCRPSRPGAQFGAHLAQPDPRICSLTPTTTGAFIDPFGICTGAATMLTPRIYCPSSMA